MNHSLLQRSNRKRSSTALDHVNPPFKGWWRKLFANNNTDPLYDKDKVVHSKTYDDASVTPAPTGRDFTETEYTMELRCYDKATNQLIENPVWLYDLLNANNRSGATELAQLSSNSAFITNADNAAEYNDLSWDPASHQYRMENPYVWLAVAGEDIPVGSSSTTPAEDRVRIDFDLFDDFYFDTDNFDLLKRGYTIRARIRRRVDLTRNPRMQRLLIQVKQGAIVTPEGLKEVHKYEDRVDRTQGDFPDEMIDELLDDTKKGINEWENYVRGGTGATSNYILPVQRLYNDLRLIEEIETILLPLKQTPNLTTRNNVVKQLQAMQTRAEVIASADISELLRTTIADLNKATSDAEVAQLGVLNTDLKGENLLPDTQGMDDILALEEKAFIRSYRGRFHLAETSVESMKLFYDMGRQLLGNMQPQMQAYLADNKAAKHGDVKDLEKIVSQFLSSKPTDTKTADPFNDLFTGMNVGAAPRDHLEKILSATPVAASDATPTSQQVDEMDQQKEVARRVNEVVQNIADKLSANGNELYNLVTKSVANADGPTNILKIREAGSAVQGLWFDKAREFYVPLSTRGVEGGGDFIIDTLDISGMYTSDAFGTSSLSDVTDRVEPDRTKMIGNRVSNDLQIEADREEPYRNKMTALINKMEIDAAGNQPLLDKIKELRLAIDQEGTGSAQIPILMNEIKTLSTGNANVTLDVRLYEGASFVFDQYKNKLQLMARSKEQAILQKIQQMVDTARQTDKTIPECYFKWEPVTLSRGEMALEQVRKSTN